MVIEKRISIKRVPYEIPCYSLSSDLLGYRQCSLQYRFVRISQLPPSRPVQMWFGEFIHFVLEHTFKFYKKRNRLPPHLKFQEICKKIRKKLATRGVFARNERIYTLAVDRVNLILKIFGNDLFNLMEHAEKKVSGTENFDDKYDFLPADKFEITGVIDILSKSKLQLHDKALKKNIIRDAIVDEFNRNKKEIPSKEELYEIIVDYKGMIRPLIKNPMWERHKLQLLLYKFLREKQPEANKVIAGIIIYVNEIKPSESDMKDFFKYLDLLDIKPDNDSNDLHAIKSNDPDKLSIEYKIKRTLRVEVLDEEEVQEALSKFKDTIIEIEKRKHQEKIVKNILQTWKPKQAPNKDTCAPCDYRYKCPVSPRHGIPESPFDYDERFDFQKDVIDIDFFTKGDLKIVNRANDISDEKVTDLYYDDYIIEAIINDKVVKIDFNKKEIFHSGCTDFTTKRKGIKTFCKHLYKLYQTLIVQMGEDIVSDILRIIGEEIIDWNFESGKN